MELPTAFASSLQLETVLEDKLDVRELSIDDGINTLFSVELEVMCENPALDFEALVGKPAAFRMELNAARYAECPRRSWTGVIAEAHLLRSDECLSTYHVTLMPHLWLLTHRTNCRVFQQMTDLAIVKQLLGEWNIDFSDMCSISYKTRKYRVQYQESDFAFVCRLLEAAGVSYFFRAEGDSSRLVLTDAPERGAARRARLEYTDNPTAGAVHATRMRASRAVTSGVISVADHDHRLPNQPLVAEGKASLNDVESQLENFIYMPGMFRHGTQGPNDTPAADDRGRTRTDMGEAQRIVSQLGAAAMARARRMTFDTNALDLEPGLSLAVDNHPFTERTGDMLVVRTTWTGTHASEAHVSVHAVPASAPFRPEASTPPPRNNGFEMATVVGPAGEDIHCDEFGRVRVQFHWDRYGKMDEMSSCWIPVNQPWAGDGLGAINIPRVGQEVMVGFVDGNPEEPLIIGRMYTNLIRPPHSTPLKKEITAFVGKETRGGSGRNEFHFDDTNGALRLFRHAGRNEDTETVANRTEWVGMNRSARVDANRSSSIGGNDRKEVEGSEHETIRGDQSHSVFGDKIGDVVGNLLSKAGGSRIMRTVGAMVSSAFSHTFESRIVTTIRVGKSSITMTPESIVIESPKVLLNPGDEIAERAALGLSTAKELEA